MSQKYPEIVNKTQMIILIIQIYFVPFKIIPIRGNTHMPALRPVLETLFISRNRDGFQLLQRIFFYGLYGFETLSAKRQFQFGEQKEVTWCHIWWVRCLRSDVRWMFGQKITNNYGCVSRHIVVQNPWVFRLQIWPFASLTLVLRFCNTICFTFAYWHDRRQLKWMIFQPVANLRLLYDPHWMIYITHMLGFWTYNYFWMPFATF